MDTENEKTSGGAAAAEAETESHSREDIEEQSQEDLKKVYKEYTHDRNVIINHFKGSINAPFSSGGNVNIGSAEMQVSPLDEEELSRLEEIYEPVPNHRQLYERLKNNHLLFIHHADHIGKFTAGLISLKNVVKTLYQISPSVLVKDLMEAGFQPETGYIIDNFDTASMESFDEFALKKLQQKLRAAGSYLVITHNDDHIHKPELAAFTIRGEAPQDIMQAIENHMYLQNISPMQMAKVKKVLEIDEFIEFLETSKLKPREIEGLTEKLSAVIGDKASFEEVFASLAQNVQKRIAEWFRQQEDFNLITFKIALAVFNEREYRSVSTAAKRLKLHAMDKDLNQSSSPFKYSKEKLLAEIQAEEFETSINTHHGLTKRRHLRFQNPADAEAVLLHVWLNYPDEHRAIINWIKEEAEVDSLAISERLAEVLACMCQTEPDFYFLLKEIIEPWAKSKNFNYRLTAGLTLAHLSLQKEHIGRIGRLVHSWAMTQNEGMQWTAAFAYGTAVGINLLPQALLDLKKIFSENTGFTREVALDSFTWLFTYGNENPLYFEQIADFKCWWIEHKTNDLDAVLALQAFIGLLDGIKAETLINLSQNKKVVRKSMVQLTGEAVRRTTTRRDMLAVLEKWFRSVDENPDLAPVVEYFFMALIVEAEVPMSTHIFSIFNKVITSPQQKNAIAIAKNIMD